jgi:protein associated with RNAse G/E
MKRMKPGDIITVRALHADGECYRWWQTPVESIRNDCIITLNSGPHIIHHTQGNSLSHLTVRSFYWLDKPYNLLEVYSAAGVWQEIYVNVASIPTIDREALTFTDHELDVSLIPGQAARIVDQDEFEAAIARYGYSTEFQAHCWRVAEEACALAEGWLAVGLRPIAQD